MPGGGGGALGDAPPIEAGGGGVEDGTPHYKQEVEHPLTFFLVGRRSGKPSVYFLFGTKSSARFFELYMKKPTVYFLYGSKSSPSFLFHSRSGCQHQSTYFLHCSKTSPPFW